MSVIPMDRLQRSDGGLGSPHLVLLGAGASLAALPHGDKRGCRPPLMSNFVSTLGLEPLLRAHGVRHAPDDFEKLYGALQANPPLGELLVELDRRIRDYFACFTLPDAPTLYDHLLLSLRRKDIVATFNWDPLLVQAYERNLRFTRELPTLAVLHGSVAVGYCPTHLDRSGRPGTRCGACDRERVPTPLLYPVEHKDYLSDPFIARQWDAVGRALRQANLVTVFGYSAPRSDCRAVQLLRSAWTGRRLREVLNTEVIDVKPEVDATWRSVFYSRHREVCPDFYDSWLARHPRRTCEAAFRRFRLNQRQPSDSLPAKASFAELYAWLAPLLRAERAAEGADLAA